MEVVHHVVHILAVATRQCFPVNCACLRSLEVGGLDPGLARRKAKLVQLAGALRGDDLAIRPELSLQFLCKVVIEMVLLRDRARLPGPRHSGSSSKLNLRLLRHWGWATRLVVGLHTTEAVIWWQIGITRRTIH